jgi:hypothetical protein
VHVSATVQRERQGRYLLRWHATGAHGQTLRFQSVSAASSQTIVESARAAGHATFVPAMNGTAGRPRIRVLVTHDGIPRTELTAGSFRAPRPAPPTPVTGLRLVRHGTSVLIMWRASKAAADYRVYVNVSDGRRLFFDVTPRHRSLRIPKVRARASVTARIAIESRAGQIGRSASAKIAARSKRRR